VLVYHVFGWGAYQGTTKPYTKLSYSRVGYIGKLGTLHTCTLLHLDDELEELRTLVNWVHYIHAHFFTWMMNWVLMWGCDPDLHK
jgi:hypothetical protein